MTRISQTVRASHDPDGAVLLEVSEGKIYGLNPVASRILLLLAEGLGNEQIAAVISREFSTDLETVRKDVAEFLDQLAKYRLIAENNDLPENGKS